MYVQSFVTTATNLGYLAGKWLLVFDSIEDISVLDGCWAVICRDYNLFTARSRDIAYETVAQEVEILTFDPDSGANFLLNLWYRSAGRSMDVQDFEAAVEFSKVMEGHLLAIIQINGLIHRWQWTIPDFLKQYTQYIERTQVISEHTVLSVVWQYSFQTLNEGCNKLLGVLSYVMPDDVPETLFLFGNDTPSFPESLYFCKNEST